MSNGIGNGSSNGGGNNGVETFMDLNVSASETSKGGLKYEVIIGEPKVVTPPRVASPANVTPKPIISAELIKLRQETAAERRLSLEADRRASLNEKFRKIEEAARRREEEIAKTKENLEKRIEAHVEKRETLISDLKTKLINHHTNHVQEVIHNAKTGLSDFENKTKEGLNNKLETHEQNREKVFQERIENLKKHDEKVEMVRNRRDSSICESGDANPIEK